MKLTDLLKNISYKVLAGELDVDIKGIEYDSRKVNDSSLFVAIKGYDTDGHLYIKEALAKGAKVIVLENEAFVEDYQDVVFIKVDNSRRTLGLLSSIFFGEPSKKLIVVGVTGTNGKTSITYLLKSILQEAGYKTGIIGTIENQIGEKVYESNVTTPESRYLQELLHEMVMAECQYCLMEASSHALFLDRVAGIQFKAGIFTNLTQDHLDFHQDLDEYLEAKKLLFKLVEVDGFSIINIDDPVAKSVIEIAKGEVTTYGLKNDPDYKATEINLKLEGTEYLLQTKIDKEKINLKLIGEFSIYNSLAAIAAADKLGIAMETIRAGIKKVKVNGRFEVVNGISDFAVVVDYAHTPDGLANVLSTARKITKGRVICVFGCGGDRDKKKRPIMGRVAGELSDIVIITSDNPRTEEPNSIIDMIEAGVKERTKEYLKIENRKAAIEKGINIARKDDIIVIAGKGHEDYQIIGKIKYHFSDREVAEEYLRSIAK